MSDQTFYSALQSKLDTLQTEDVQVATEVEENKIVTRLTMPSRKLKIRISNELLTELEKLQINFKLN